MKYMLAELKGLRDEAGKAYEVHHTLLNTRIHGGLPPHRPRIYITGLMQSMKQRDFAWPSPIPCAPLNDLLSPKKGPARRLAIRHSRIAQLPQHAGVHQ